MASATQFTNADGLVRRYGVTSAEDKRPKLTATNVKQTLVVDFTYEDITAVGSTGFYDADASGGDTPDSFSDAVPFIPAGSIITATYIVATTAWTGTAVIDIGFEQQDGSVQDVDGLYDGLDVDDAADGLATVGASPLPNGVLTQNTTGTYDPDGTAGFNTENMYIRVHNQSAGTLTAGAARLVVEYIAP